MNFRSVVNKADELAAIIDSVKADLLFRTELEILEILFAIRYYSLLEIAKCFRQALLLIKKIHPARVGAFFLVRCSLYSAELDIAHEEVEFVWYKVTMQDNSSFAAGTFYRSPNSSVPALKYLHEIVLEASCYTFILAGDFNLPDLSWRDGTCEVAAGGTWK